MYSRYGVYHGSVGRGMGGISNWRNAPISMELPLISRGITRIAVRVRPHFFIPLMEMAFFRCFLNGCFSSRNATNDPANLIQETESIPYHAEPNKEREPRKVHQRDHKDPTKSFTSTWASSYETHPMQFLKIL